MRQAKANRRAAKRLLADTDSLLDRLNARLTEKLAELRADEDEKVERPGVADMFRIGSHEREGR